MNTGRPTLVWAVAALCAATVVVALAVVSARVLDYERERELNAAEADLGERVRLALWRMESDAASILTVENSRPVDQFRPFFTPSNNWDISNAKPASESFVMSSALLDSSPGYARLHFELDADGLRSPQVPRGSYQILAEQQGRDGAQALEAGERLATLGERLELRPELLPETLRDRARMLDLQVQNQAWNAVPQEMPGQSQQLSQRPQIGQSIAGNRAEDAGYDRQQRATTVARVAEKGILPKSQSDTDSQTLQNPEILFGRRDQLAEPASDASRARAADEVKNINDVNDVNKVQNVTPPVATEPGPTPAVTPYQASWIGEDLFLMRRVGDDSDPRIQGVWLEKERLEQDLLEGITDLLPLASLTPIDPDIEAGPLALVSLPYQLNAGELPVLPPLAWTPTRLLLAWTWAAVLAALIAAWVLLGGVVRLSERRASFVSSVTHELRTPLTTFKLYSEMLADNMVPDAKRRGEYFGTLRREADRLSHLVENVLSYSRIERGSARARREHTSIGGLLERVLPRLRERAQDVGMEIVTQLSADVAETDLETDLTAVEQILFNLVDNAAKYAAEADSSRALELAVSRQGRFITMALRDHGPGVAPGMRRKLFRAFSKSAAEAAVSKPGVGLGLALSRRLARSLGGDLVYQPAEPGACFVLKLPC